MKITIVPGTLTVGSIEFCCRKMGIDVLTGKVVSAPWSSSVTPKFHTSDGYKLNFCGHCGAKIETINLSDQF